MIGFIQLGIKAAQEAMIDSGFITIDNSKPREKDAPRFGIISWFLGIEVD